MAHLNLLLGRGQALGRQHRKGGRRGGSPHFGAVFAGLAFAAASAYTAARLLNGASISGKPLGLRIAPGSAADFTPHGRAA